MKLLLLTFFVWFNVVYSSNRCLDCYSYDHEKFIENLLKDYEDTCERRFFSWLPL